MASQLYARFRKELSEKGAAWLEAELENLTAQGLRGIAAEAQLPQRVAGHTLSKQELVASVRAHLIPAQVAWSVLLRCASRTYVRALTHTHTRTHVHARTRAHMHTETFTGICSCTFTHTISSKRTPVYCLIYVTHRHPQRLRLYIKLCRVQR